MNEQKAEKHGRFKFAAPESAYPQSRRPSAAPAAQADGQEIDLAKAPDDTSEHDAVTADTEPAPAEEGAQSWRPRR